MSHSDPMINPRYTRWTGEKVSLRGCVLVFGSGQLAHEQEMFDFTAVESIKAYDPFEKLNTEELPDGVKEKVEYHDNLDSLLNENSHEFDTILCVFSLHYEPQWLYFLSKLLNALKDRGSLFFCEDKGFRALLDGSYEHNDIYEKDDFPGIVDAFSARITIKHAVPWQPDLSASDASLLADILMPFGTLEPIIDFAGTRAIDTTAEPQCYLPWNPDRIDVPPSLVESIRGSLNEMGGEVEEKIRLYEFEKISNTSFLFNPFDPSEPKARLIWRAIGDRAGRALGQLLISWQEHNPRASDLPFRKAALSLLYQNLFRHFDFWKTTELIVGALSPEFTLTSPSKEKAISDYQSACVEPGEKGRFWTVKDRKGQYLQDYENNLIKQKRGWVGEELYKRAEGGVYCWTQEENRIPSRPEDWRVILPGTDLFTEFSVRNTPDCVYIIDALATRERALFSKKRNLLFGALIVYLREAFLNSSEEDIVGKLRCFLFAMENSRAILVGRAGFLEIEMVQRHLQDAEAIQEPLKTLQDEARSLQKISEAVERLSARLDPDSRTPGLSHFWQLQRILAEKLFDSETHEPYQVKTDKLVTTMCSVEFAKAKEDFLMALGTERSRLRPETIDNLFSPLWATGKTQNAAGFAKAIARGGIPLAWLRVAAGSALREEDCAFYIEPVPDAGRRKSDFNPVNFLLALDAICRVGKLTIDTIEREQVGITIRIEPDIHGVSGLSRLKELFEERKTKGETSRNLKLLGSRAIDPTVGWEGDSLKLVMKFEIIPLKVAEPDDDEF
uniref:Methyltransferase domain-containing protein n=1 Tax=Candidatus Kentrum sp. UNK TaxID=2126344 RepID=A0A451AXS3_9GAMM|nr:MAG: hypothetical protein BECKUNK1418G_GA0071005_103427 [Candidatus Kentron sp. UNK]VFK70854.1 MAG: hypothetical protein BECKUNK1418H_GA0071006_104028 [Candidatus Kentron sp. UNK]